MRRNISDGINDSLSQIPSVAKKINSRTLMSGLFNSKIIQFVVLPIVMAMQEEDDKVVMMQYDSDTEIDLSQSIFIGSNYTSVDKIRSQSCYDGSCTSCIRNINNKKVCYECRDTCECARIIDSSLVEGGYDTLLNYSYSYSSVTGGNSTAMIFDGYARLDLSPSDLDEEIYVTNFKISFRFKTYAISYVQLIMIMQKLYYKIIVQII